MMNRFYYNVKNAWTFKEIYMSTSFNFPLTKQKAAEFISEYEFYVPASGTNAEVDPYNCTFKSDETIYQIINQVYERFKNHYIIISRDNLRSSEEVENLEKDWRLKFLSLLNWTYPKYSSILKAYNDNKANLMNQLSSTDSETHSTSQSENHSDQYLDGSETKINDTPQEEDVEAEYDDDQYVSELHKSKVSHNGNGSSSITGSGSISKSHSYDNDTIMARIAEIERNYSMTMLKWLNEFDKLFIEEGNI